MPTPSLATPCGSGAHGQWHSAWSTGIDAADSARMALTLANGTRVVAVHRPGAKTLTAFARVVAPGVPTAVEQLAQAVALPAKLHDMRRGVWIEAEFDAEGEMLFAVARAIDRDSALEQLADSLFSHEPEMSLAPVIMQRAGSQMAAARAAPETLANALLREAEAPTQAARRALVAGPFAPLSDAADWEAVGSEMDTATAAQNHPSNTELLLLGPSPPTELLDAAEHAFGRARGAVPPVDSQAQAPPPAAAESSPVRIVDDPHAALAEVWFRCPLAPRDRATSRVLGAVIDADLMDELRYASGSAYGVRATVEGPLQGGALQISTRVAPGAAGSAIGYMRAIVERLREGLSPDPLARAKGVGHAEWGDRGAVSHGWV